MRTVVLSNGMNVLFHPMPNTHSVTVGLYIKCGQYHGESKIGITHLLEHLHFRQLGNMTQNELYYKMESIGSTLRAVTYKDLLKFSMKTAPCYIEDCIDIFSSIIDANEWSESSFLKEKSVVLNQIAEKGDYVSIDQRVRESVFFNHFMASEIMGTAEQVESITIEDVVEYKNQIFNSSDLLVCVTGNITETDMQRIENDFKKCRVSENTNDRKILLPKEFGRRKPKIDFAVINDSSPIEVNLSFDISYENVSIDELILLNCILGEGVGSKLQRRIREEKCFSSDICSYVEQYCDYAILHILFSVGKCHFIECLNEVVDVISDTKFSITKEDLDVSLPFYTVNQMFNEDDTEEMNYQLAYNKLIFDKPYKPIGCSNNKSTIKKLNTIAKEIFVCNNLCFVAVGNTSGITKKSVKNILKKLC